MHSLISQESPPLYANSRLTYENHDKEIFTNARQRNVIYLKQKSQPETENSEIAWGKIFLWAQYDIWSFNAVQFLRGVSEISLW